MAAEMNVQEVIASVRSTLDRIDFTMTGPSGDTLGHDVAMAVVEAIQERAARQETPDGMRWPPNSLDYTAEKWEKYGWTRTNYRTGQMLSTESLYGRTTVTTEGVDMVYGTDEPPMNSSAPSGYMSPEDQEITDVEKAQYAHEQGREFYGTNDQDAEKIKGLIEDAIARHIGFGADIDVGHILG